MQRTFYQLTDQEKNRLRHGIIACLSVPFIEDVEDFVWEAVFHYFKDIHLPDPIREGRSKKLFDAVDASSRTGWSLKALQRQTVEVGSYFEFVIQRADIFKKAKKLGFDELTVNSPVDDLGRALVRHWNEKHLTDAIAQGVKEPRMAVLLKRRSRERFAYIELGACPSNTFGAAMGV